MMVCDPKPGDPTSGTVRFAEEMEWAARLESPVTWAEIVGCMPSPPLPGPSTRIALAVPDKLKDLAVERCRRAHLRCHAELPFALGTVDAELLGIQH